MSQRSEPDSSGEEPTVRDVVLDAMYLRAAHPAALRELRERGYRLSVTALTLQEVWARSVREDTYEEFCRRLGTLATLLDANQPVVPAARQLLCCMTLDDPEVWEAAHDHGRMLWRRWSDPALSRDEWSKLGVAAGSDTDTHGAEHVRLDRAATGSVSAAVAKVLDVNGFAGYMAAELASEHPAIAHRIDAFIRVAAFRTARRIVSRNTRNMARPASPNDAEDEANLLQLGRPAVLLTREHDLIEDVVASGSPQAPWVVSLGELLTDPVPTGVPWAGATPTQRRSRAERNELEEEAVRKVKSERIGRSAPPSGSGG